MPGGSASLGSTIPSALVLRLSPETMAWSCWYHSGENRTEAFSTGSPLSLTTVTLTTCPSGAWWVPMSVSPVTFVSVTKYRSAEPSRSVSSPVVSRWAYVIPSSSSFGTDVLKLPLDEVICTSNVLSWPFTTT
jgi:hypothetical protein